MSPVHLLGAALEGTTASVLIKVTAILLAATVATLAMRRASAATRHLVWLVALIACVALALLSPLVPAIGVAIPTAVASAGTAAQALALPLLGAAKGGRANSRSRDARAAESPAAPPTTSSAAEQRTPAALTPTTTLTSTPDYGRIAAILWLLGCLVVGGRYVAARLALARLVRRSQREPSMQASLWEARLRAAARDAGISRSIGLCVSDGLSMPATYGSLHPVVVLPSDADEWTDERRQIVLVHELAHVARFDVLAQSIANLTCALFWFHPVAWWGAARLRDEAEQAADDRVLLAGTPGATYASHLLDLARARHAPRWAPVAVGMTRSSHLEARFRAMLDTRRSRTPVSLRNQVVATALACAAMVPIATLRGVAVPGGAARAVAGGSSVPVVSAPPSAVAQQQPAISPPVRMLGPKLATVSDSFGEVRDIRQLSDGRLLVNDVGRGRLILYDAALSHPVLLADRAPDSAGLSRSRDSSPSGNGAAIRYDCAGGALIAFLGDSSLFVKPASDSVLVIDPNGKVARSFAAPAWFVRSLGGAAIDALGRLLYLPTREAVGGPGTGGSSRPRNGCDFQTPMVLVNMSAPPPKGRDSRAVVRLDVRGHSIDTVGFIAVPFYPIRPQLASVLGDSWAVLADGSVAFVRSDYHIDWVNSDGTRASTPPMPHDVRRLTQAEKIAMVDSARHQSDLLYRAADSTYLARPESARKIPAVTCTGDSLGGRCGGTDAGPPTPEPEWLRPIPGDLPDTLPVFAWAMADADDNLWISRLDWNPPQDIPRTINRDGEPPIIYDIVNRRGQVVDRVHLPSGLIIAGFGPGVVYLTGSGEQATSLAKYRIK